MNPTTNNKSTANRTCHLLRALLSIVILQIVDRVEHLIVSHLVLIDIPASQHHVLSRIKILACAELRHRGERIPAEDCHASEDNQHERHRRYQCARCPPQFQQRWAVGGQLSLSNCSQDPCVEK